jgi:DNA/RNA-binding domain of Phe-tRNA-synthetase-like protein
MNYDLKISKDPGVSDRLKAGILFLQDVECQNKNSALWDALENIEKQYRSRFETPSEALPLLKPARKLFHALGIEPTRIRPSSEALLRRIIKGKPLYQINSLVDAGNLASLSFLLPIGLYDGKKINGPIRIRRGLEGESYEGIGKRKVNVSGRITLIDQTGPFGNPSSDSRRTSIGIETSEVIMVIFAPKNYSEEQLQKHLNLSQDILLKYHPSGIVKFQDILA